MKNKENVRTYLYLVERVYEQCEYTKKTIKDIIRLYDRVVVKECRDGYIVRLGRLGTLETRYREGYSLGRSKMLTQHGETEPLYVAARREFHFTPSVATFNAVNPHIFGRKGRTWRFDEETGRMTDRRRMEDVPDRSLVERAKAMAEKHQQQEGE